MNMEQQAKPILCETISAVRRAGRKRGVPFDLATFLTKEAGIAEARVHARCGMAADADIPNGTLQHVHLIGDALVAAEFIAVDCGEGKSSDPDRFRIANDRVRALLSKEGVHKKDRQFCNELQPLVDEKKALVQILAEMFGLKIEVLSAIDFIRQREKIADRITKVLGAVFRDDGMLDIIDSAKYVKIRDELPVDGTHFPSFMSWMDIARSTLPKSKLSDSFIEQARRAYYGATEGGIHAGVIDQGGEVVTYEGSEHAPEKPPTKIIRNMQRLVELALYHLQEIELARKVHNHLSIEPRLNGIGVVLAPLGIRPTDPFTLEYDAANRELLAPQKLPFLIFEGTRLRPVTTAEVLSVVRDSAGGITGVRARPWDHNLCAIAKLLNADEGRFDHPAIKRLMDMHGVERHELKDWAGAIVCGSADQLGVQSDDADKRKRRGPPVPSGTAEFAGAFVEAIAYEVLEGMERILGKGAMAGSSATIVPMSNGSATPEAAAPAPEAAATAPQAPAPEVSAPASEQPPASGAEPKE